jgi:isopenicillin-N epimerase
MLDRREFVKRSTVAAALFGLPLSRAEEAFGQEAPQLPASEMIASNPEHYWTELRRQWLLAADRINLNCGSMGCTPLPVLRAMIDHLLTSEAFREPDYPWFGYEENRTLRELRDALAAFLRCRRDELALVRNATEGNNLVCNGLDMKPGDEVLLTDQEHPGGRCCWEQKAARFGVKLNIVKLPKPPASVDEIVDRFNKALTARTRLMFLSHITSPRG